MKGNNLNNIKNILVYLNKLNDDKEFLLSEVNDIILNTLTQLELQNLDIAHLNYNNIINLLKTHRNKKKVREFLSNNLDKIILYNTLHTDYNDLGYISAIANVYNKNIIISLVMENKEQLRKDYSDKEINGYIEEIKENNDDWGEEVYIGENLMYNLIDFTLDLITISEIGLAKKVFNISNKLHYFGGDSYNYELIKLLIIKEANILKTIINFMGEDEFIKNYSLIIFHKFPSENVKFLENLVKLGKYDLLVKIIQIYIDEDYESKGKIIYKTLQVIKKAIQSKNDDLILKYIKYINFNKNQ